MLTAVEPGSVRRGNEEIQMAAACDSERMKREQLGDGRRQG